MSRGPRIVGDRPPAHHERGIDRIARAAERQLEVKVLESLNIERAEPDGADRLAGGDRRFRLTAPAALVATIADKQIFQLYFSKREIEFLNDCWKRLPVIHVPSPMRMRYETGEGLLYYVHWAEQFIVDRRIVPQEPELLALADRLGTWVRAHFTSARGKRAFDNHAEYERLK